MGGTRDDRIEEKNWTKLKKKGRTFKPVEIIAMNTLQYHQCDRNKMTELSDKKPSPPPSTYQIFDILDSIINKKRQTHGDNKKNLRMSHNRTVQSSLALANMNSFLGFHARSNTLPV